LRSATLFIEVRVRVILRSSYSVVCIDVPLGIVSGWLSVLSVKLVITIYLGTA
jgi:hypothetical protein